MPSQLPGRAVRWTPRGLTDAIDGTEAFPGAMSMLQNLIPDPRTPGLWVPRPASLGIAGSGSAPTRWGSFVWGGAAWGGFDGVSGAAQITALFSLGEYVYGLIASTIGPYAGLDVPFCYNVQSQSWLTIGIPRGAAVLPASQATSGDWTPPTVAAVGSRIVFTHPGFPGGPTKFGWLDISGFSDATHTGNTNSSTTINNLSANVLQAGWQPGMLISSSAGDIPPNTTILSIAAGGTSLTLSQAATGSNVGVTLTVTGGTPTAPLWDAGDVNLNPLAAVPVAVFNFNGRAYYAVPGAGAPFSDAGLPCNRTNATQALVPNNGLNITAWGGLPFTQVTGGTLQALIGFQGDVEMQQITGDPTTQNLAISSLDVGVGTLAPNTIANTPFGLAFISEDGMRYLNFLGNISDVVGSDSRGVIQAFQNAVNPSRMCAAYNQDVYRVSVQNGAAAGQPVVEYWYHVSRKVWSGPHTFPASLIAAYQAIEGHGFVFAAFGINAELWSSTCIPTILSSYTENGQAMQYSWQTVLLPDNQDMTENAVIETTVALSLPLNSTATLQATNEAGVVIGGPVTISGPTGAAPAWGTAVWGSFTWGGQQGYLSQYDVPWTGPLVFKQMQVQADGVCEAGFSIGNLYFKARPLGYRMQAMAGVAAAGGAI